MLVIRLQATIENPNQLIFEQKVVCLILAFAPKFGVYLSNALGFFKLAMLLFIVVTGFAALAGNTEGPPPDNFSSFDGAGDACPLSYGDTSSRAANFALALIQVLYAYSGWENANNVLTEVHNAPRTLKLAAPLASLTVTTLYILANISYVLHFLDCVSRRSKSLTS